MRNTGEISLNFKKDGILSIFIRNQAYDSLKDSEWVSEYPEK